MEPQEAFERQDWIGLEEEDSVMEPKPMELSREDFTLSQDAIEKAHEAYHAHGWNLTEAIKVACAIEFSALRSELQAAQADNASLMDQLLKADNLLAAAQAEARTNATASIHNAEAGKRLEQQCEVLAQQLAASQREAVRLQEIEADARIRLEDRQQRLDQLQCEVERLKGEKTNAKS